MAEQLVGSVISVIGPVVDFVFPDGHLPEIYDAVYVDLDDGALETFEVEQQLGDGVVRAVSMGSTDGLRRGMTAIPTASRSPCRWVRRPWGASST